MSDKVKLSKDGSSIDFVQSDSLPTSLKKFRQSPEIEGFYRFIFENDLQKEAFEILEKIVIARKAKKQKDKQDAQPAKKEAQAQKISQQAKPTVKVSPSPIITKKKPVIEVISKKNVGKKK